MNPINAVRFTPAAAVRKPADTQAATLTPAAPSAAPAPVRPVIAQAGTTKAGNPLVRGAAILGGALAGGATGGAVGAMGSVLLGAALGLGEAYLGLGMLAMCGWAIAGAIGGVWGVNKLLSR